MASTSHHFSRPLAGLGAILLLSVTAPVAIAESVARSESSAEAREWLDKMMAVYDGSSFTMEYRIHLDLSEMGQPIRGSGKGKIVYGDREHRRMEMRLEMTGLPGPDGESTSPTELEMIIVSDGETQWVEMNAPEMGGHLVFKSSLEAAHELASDAGFGGNPAGMDPVTQLEALAETLDFEVADVSGGRVTLRGTVDPDAAGELGTLGSLGVGTFILVADAKSHFPIEIRAGDPADAIRMEFFDTEKLSRDQLPPDAFDYTPPKGVEVTDLSAALSGSE